MDDFSAIRTLCLSNPCCCWHLRDFHKSSNHHWATNHRNPTYNLVNSFLTVFFHVTRWCFLNNLSAFVSLFLFSSHTTPNMNKFVALSIQRSYKMWFHKNDDIVGVAFTIQWSIESILFIEQKKIVLYSHQPEKKRSCEFITKKKKNDFRTRTFSHSVKPLLYLDRTVS